MAFANMGARGVSRGKGLPGFGSRLAPIVLAGIVIVIAAALALRLGRTSPNAPADSAVAEVTPPVYSTGTPESGGVVAPTASVSEIALAIVSPADKDTVSEPRVSVRGRTAPNAEVFINEVETRADASGNFSATVPLEEGENYILVVANDERGSFSEKELTVTYIP